MVVDSVFFVCFAVGNNRRKRSFAARACRSRNGYEHRDFLADFQKTFHLAYGLFGSSHSRADYFCAVHRRAAAESDDALTVALFVHFQSVLYVVNRRIGYRIVIHGAIYTPFFESVDNRSGRAQSEEIGSRDEKHAFDALTLDKSRQVFYAAVKLQNLGLSPRQKRRTNINCLLKKSVPAFLKYVHSLSSL